MIRKRKKGRAVGRGTSSLSPTETELIQALVMLATYLNHSAASSIALSLGPHVGTVRVSVTSGSESLPKL